MKNSILIIAVAVIIVGSFVFYKQNQYQQTLEVYNKELVRYHDNLEAFKLLNTSYKRSLDRYFYELRKFNQVMDFSDQHKIKREVDRHHFNSEKKSEGLWKRRR